MVNVDGTEWVGTTVFGSAVWANRSGAPPPVLSAVSLFARV